MGGAFAIGYSADPTPGVPPFTGWEFSQASNTNVDEQS